MQLFQSYGSASTIRNGSVADLLDSIGVNSSKANRKAIASAYGISNYTGTAATAVESVLNAGHIPAGFGFLSKIKIKKAKMPSTGFMRQAGSMGLDFIPVVGNVKSGIEAIMGKDLVTGQKLSTTERIIAGVGIFTGGAGKTALKGISAGVSLGLTSSKAAKAC